MFLHTNAILAVEAAWKGMVIGIRGVLNEADREHGGKPTAEGVRMLEDLLPKIISLCNLLSMLGGPSLRQLVESSALGGELDPQSYKVSQVKEYMNVLQLTPAQRTEVVHMQGKFEALRRKMCGPLACLCAAFMCADLTPSCASLWHRGAVSYTDGTSARTCSDSCVRRVNHWRVRNWNVCC